MGPLSVDLRTRVVAAVVDRRSGVQVDRPARRCDRDARQVRPPREFETWRIGVGRSGAYQSGDEVAFSVRVCGDGDNERSR